MSSFSEKYIRGARYLLPAPFTIAIILTLIVYIISVLGMGNGWLETAEFWEGKLWEGNNFAFQCMYMLVVGHIIALSKPFDKATDWLLDTVDNGATAALVVTLVSVITGLFNWGLGLITGAIFARKVGEYAKRNSIPIHYGIIGAAGYAGLMVWHGGLSGSAPLLISKEHELSSLMGIIPTSETIFSKMNIAASLLLMGLLPILMFFVAKKTKPVPIYIPKSASPRKSSDKLIGAEKLDHSHWFARITGFVLLAYVIYRLVDVGLFNLGLNIMNLALFAIAVLLHKNIFSFIRALDRAIVDGAGILIQFPLYFGIMGIMQDGGIAHAMSDYFVSISTALTLPLYTFISAGIINVFVPSGGGQWAVQGPIIIEACQALGVDLSKGIMAMCYGDQLTNMLQPFWALPLLGITGLKAKDILPYTLILMLGGIVIFTIVLLIF